MDTIVLFDPGIRSLNKGDEIIMRSAERELSGFLTGRFVIKSATHAPIVTCYQNLKMNPKMRIYLEAKYKFICGSNLLWRNMLKPRPALNVNWFNCMPYTNSILVGVGTDGKENKLNAYTRKLYSKILSKDFIHSVRDEETGLLLAQMGYRYINTGCPTMWQFTPAFCRDIPQSKSDEVVFTLTDYNRDPQRDQALIDILRANYKKVNFWIQGVFDKEYYDSLDHTDGITVIPPSLEAFSSVLHRDVDYIGTRLHAGMFATQHKKRAIILAVDNRVRDMTADYDINTIERTAIDQLPAMIQSDFSTNIRIRSENIEQWLAQFEA